MNKLIYLLVFIFVVLQSCEDNKKASEKKSVPIDVLNKEKIVDKKTSELIKRTYTLPYITNENVDSLLLDYGSKNRENKVKISTSYGNIELLLYNDTPLHRANFIYLIKNNYFTETFFHRVVPNFIIQAGSSDNISTNKKRAQIGRYRLESEIIPGRNHIRGTLSGAKHYRKNPDKKSTPFEFFIFLGEPNNAKHLDDNYTIFGKVTKGMEVVDILANLASDEGDWPLENVYITVEIIK